MVDVTAAPAVAPRKDRRGMEAKRAGRRGEALLTFDDLTLRLPELAAAYRNTGGSCYG